MEPTQNNIPKSEKRENDAASSAQAVTEVLFGPRVWVGRQKNSRRLQSDVRRRLGLMTAKGFAPCEGQDLIPELRKMLRPISS